MCLQLIKVVENSMAPRYQSGDYVLVVKGAFFMRRLRRADVVVFHQPEYGLMIKNVTAVDPVDGAVTVLGTHPESVDSRWFGAVPREQLVGKVIWHVRRPRVVE